MKNLFQIICFVLFLVACNDEKTNEFVKINGTITNPTSDSLVIKDFRTRKGVVIKRIKVNPDGTFSDTFKLGVETEPTIYYIQHDSLSAINIYLKNGDNLTIDFDAKETQKTVVFSGVGEDINNFSTKFNSILYSMNGFDYFELMGMDKESFDDVMNEIEKSIDSLIDASKNLDSSFVANRKKSKDQMIARYTAFNKSAREALLMKGKASPKFKNYKNYAGGTSSLNDFKGKYVYIDIWATWCGPCKREIPFLKDAEKTYHDKNIEFVSISVDKPEDYNKWKAMVKEKKLTGIQLMADNAQKSKFFLDYKIAGIPRFILLDPKGIIVDADAPRPSDKKLIDLFNQIGI